MHKIRTKSLKELTIAVLTEMEKAHYCHQYIQKVRNSCTLLENMADRMGKNVLDDELSQAFIDDSAHFRTGAYSESRFKRRKLCIHILKSYQELGTVDRPSSPRAPILAKLTAPQFIEAHASFIHYMREEIMLKENTIDGYQRFVYHFLHYCEGKGYRTTGEIQSGDILSFLELMCRDRYQPTSIGAHLPGLKLFFFDQRVNTPTPHDLPQGPKTEEGNHTRAGSMRA